MIRLLMIDVLFLSEHKANAPAKPSATKSLLSSLGLSYFPLQTPVRVKLLSYYITSSSVPLKKCLCN